MHLLRERIAEAVTYGHDGRRTDSKTESGIDSATSEERDVRDRAGNLFRPLRERLDHEVQEFCLQAFVHIDHHLCFRPLVAMRIDVFPADEKFPSSPIDIPQVFIQAFGFRIISASDR